jgi:2-methylisocitrate lyase-like PEP mutase family enzyme
VTDSLRTLIDRRSPLVIPSIYDGMSALLVRELGFEAAYIGSHAIGATKYGLPDHGYIGLEDVADHVRRLAPLAGMPLFVDAEGGWGNPLHVAHTVHVLERAGAAAIQLEDHVFGKHLAPRTQVLPVAHAVAKLEAALDARDSDDFMIVARTDSITAEGQTAAVERVLAYQEAGADGLFIAGNLDSDHRRQLREGARVPIFIVNFPGRTPAEQAAEGASVVFYYALAHLAAFDGMRKAYEALARDGSSIAIEQSADTDALYALDRFLGSERAVEQAQRYGLVEPQSLEPEA